MKSIDHIAIQVDDIKESVDWYVDNYNCGIIHQDDTWAFLQFGNIKMALVVEDEHPYHIAFEIDGMDGKGKNWKYHRDGSISRYIDDPSGNKVELIWYMDKKKEIKHFADGFHEGRWEDDMERPWPGLDKILEDIVQDDWESVKSYTMSEYEKKYSTKNIKEEE